MNFSSGCFLGERSWLWILLFLFATPGLVFFSISLVKGLSAPNRVREVQKGSEALVFLAFQITMLMSVSVGHYIYSELFGISTVVPILGFCGDGYLIKDHVGLNTFGNLLSDYL